MSQEKEPIYIRKKLADIYTENEREYISALKKLGRIAKLIYFGTDIYKNGSLKQPNNTAFILEPEINQELTNKINKKLNLILADKGQLVLIDSPYSDNNIRTQIITKNAYLRQINSLGPGITEEIIFGPVSLSVKNKKVADPKSLEISVIKTLTGEVIYSNNYQFNQQKPYNLKVALLSQREKDWQLLLDNPFFMDGDPEYWKINNWLLE